MKTISETNERIYAYLLLQPQTDSIECQRKRRLHDASQADFFPDHKGAFSYVWHFLDCALVSYQVSGAFHYMELIEVSFYNRQTV